MSMTKQDPRLRGEHQEREKSSGRFWDFVSLLKDAAIAWYAHNVFRFAGTLAFYTVASLAPLVVTVVGIVGLVFNVYPEQFVGQVRGLVGPEAAGAVEAVIRNAQDQDSGIIATVFGLVAFFVGLTAVFFELKAALNALWGIEPGPNQSLAENIRKMLFSVALMAVLGFLLLVSLLVSTALSGLENYLTERWQNLALVWGAVNLLVTLGVALLLFALLFKYVPDVKIAFSDVWVGAAITTVLFVIGRVAIGLYLGNSGIASSYGAAGSIVVLLLWIYYSALILFFGAELTYAHANRFGSRIKPAPGARSVEPQPAGVVDKTQS